MELHHPVDSFEIRPKRQQYGQEGGCSLEIRLQRALPVQGLGDLYGRLNIQQEFGGSFTGVQQNLRPAVRIHRQAQGIRLSFRSLKRDCSGQCFVFVAKRSGHLQAPKWPGRLLSKDARIRESESPDPGMEQEFRDRIQGRGNRGDRRFVKGMLRLSARPSS